MDHARKSLIRSSWQVRCAAGEPFAVVRVRNLQAVVRGPHDAWGRPGRPQPILVSAELHFNSPFDASVAGDNVTSGDTVHYGSLSKKILACVERYSPQNVEAMNTPTETLGYSTSLNILLQMIWLELTGIYFDGSKGPDVERPFLDLSKIRFLSITITLPKASLLGEGVSLTASAVFSTGTTHPSPGVEMYALRLHLQRLRVPTLIGVNSNEREAKQFVITDIGLDQYNQGMDVYTQLESLVVKAMEESSFETLEALGSHISARIIRDFHPSNGRGYTGPLGWQIQISMEKPTAVPFAEGPVVQVRAGAGLESHRN